ncbi:hypothetical protein GCM10009765_56760 [Fodinicola feengrottensis]|uniref:Uncharacterized protein n=1 Tax=Fodinicola feengrottensis TaxID=435914 RepID=A0ABN2I7N9_9ACTN
MPADHTWEKVPVGLQAPRWRTIQPARTVLVIVHTVTAATRLADVLPVFDADLRIQVVFTTPGTSAVRAGVAEVLAALGAATIPWAQALQTEFDLAIAAAHSGSLHEINAPLVLLSHGIGYTKNTAGSRVPGPGSRVPGPGSLGRLMGCRRSGFCTTDRSSQPPLAFPIGNNSSDWPMPSRKPSTWPPSSAIRATTGSRRAPNIAADTVKRWAYVHTSGSFCSRLLGGSTRFSGPGLIFSGR